MKNKNIIIVEYSIEIKDKIKEHIINLENQIKDKDINKDSKSYIEGEIMGLKNSLSIIDTLISNKL